MSDSIPTPGKSLESDLRLIREARGLSREDIFNRVHIRPEVLAQVEEHGFSATPTLNSDIHRRSFVKHYADAVAIDSQLALAALEKSVNGLYDGVLAVEYLGLEELKPIPRWATTEDATEEDETTTETTEEMATKPIESEPVPPGSDLPDFDLPTAETGSVFPVPEPEEPAESAVEEIHKPGSKPSAKPHLKIVEGARTSSPEASDESSTPEPVTEESGESETESVVPEMVESIDAESEMVEPAAVEPTKSEPESDESIQTDAEAIKELPFELETEDGGTPPEEVPAQSELPDRLTVPPSPYAPPVGGRPPAPSVRETSTEPSAEEAEPKEPARPRHRGRREAATIPSSTLKESHIGPLEEGDLGDEESSILVKMRGRHWLAWLGLIGVVIIILFFVGRAIYLNLDQEETSARTVQSVEQLPSQFSGIVRLTPTTERFVTLQISPDSTSPTEFEYKMWTHNAGSTYAETGVGSLNTAENQILLGDPYGIGGLFVLENGRYRLRSVRRVRFPRWEFTGQAQ